MEDKVKRLMEHANIDEKTAKEALEKNNENILDAFDHLEKEKIINNQVAKKEIKNEKKYVEYNSNHRYMDANPKKPKEVKKEKSNQTEAKIQKVGEEKPINVAETSNNMPKIELKNEPAASYNMPDYNTYGDYANAPSTNDYYTPTDYDVNQYKQYTDPNLRGVGRQIIDWFSGVFNYLVKTKLIIMRKNNVIISVPIFLAVIIVMIALYGVIPFFIISLFFGFRYFVENDNGTYEDLENRVKNTYKYEEPKKAKRSEHSPYKQQNYNYPNANWQNTQDNYTKYYNNHGSWNSSENAPAANTPENTQTQNNTGYYNYGSYAQSNEEYFNETNKFQDKNNIIDLNNKKE